MKKFEKPTAEIFHFQCKDIITTSDGDHDNGFIDDGEFMYIVEDVIKKVKEIF